MSNNSKLYDFDGFASEMGVEIEDTATLFSSYIIEMKDEINNMLDYLAKEDWVMLERIVHNVKGVSANLHIADIFLAAELFDMELKQHSTEQAKYHVDEITGLLENTEKEIRLFFSARGFSI